MSGRYQEIGLLSTGEYDDNDDDGNDGGDYDHKWGIPRDRVTINR